jgi:hypothetical protein
MTTIQITRSTAAGRLRLIATALTAVTLYKFLAIAVAVALEAGWQPQVLPWGFLVVISGPLLLATVLLGRFPRSGTAVLMVASAVLVAICVLYLVTTGWPELSVSDLPLLLVGAPLGAVALVLGGRFLFNRTGRSQPA